MSHSISRRALLASLGGTALTFPLLGTPLERLARAEGIKAPQRYVIMTAGTSTGRGDFTKPALEPDMAAGSNFLKVTAPLDARGVRNKVSFVTGMQMARNFSAPGGMGLEWHPRSMPPLLCGTRGKADALESRSATSDQIVAKALAHPSAPTGVHYRIQYDNYSENVSKSTGIISYRADGANVTANEPTINAKIGFEALARKVTSADPVAQARAQAAADKLSSSVAHIRNKSAIISQRPEQDRRRLQQHFDELASYEKSLKTTTSGGGGQCLRPDPPADRTDLSGAYAFEKERAPLLADLIKFAFSCDLARVATLCVTNEQSFLNAGKIIPSGFSKDIHQLSHEGDPHLQPFLEQLAWHVDVFAYLVKGLSTTTDVDGRTLLDNTSVVYLFEGGIGADPQENVRNHSSENMVALIAGRASAAVAGGTNVRAAGIHPSGLLLTAMRNVGVDVPALGEISTPIPGL